MFTKACCLPGRDAASLVAENRLLRDLLWRVTLRGLVAQDSKYRIWLPGMVETKDSDGDPR